MKRRTMQLLSILLVLCMALALLPGIVWAAEETSGSCGDGVTWSYSDGVLTIQGTGSMTDYDYMNSRSPWFGFRDEIHTMAIGNGVTSIGNYAFLLCENLTSVTIPASVTSIGEGAFRECVNLTSITIPDGVTTIGKSAFLSCFGLTSVTIPDGVTAIEDGLFEECHSLTSVTIPNSVTTIGTAAFLGCEELASVTIPASVTSIGGAAFMFCSSLTSINVASGNSAYTLVDGVLFSVDQTLLHCYPAGKSGSSYSIPASVTTIESGAFSSILLSNWIYIEKN